MRAFRGVSGALVTIAVLAVMTIAGPQLLQDAIEQRVSGLEARVSILEDQVARLQETGQSTPSASVVTPISTAPAPVAETHQLRGLFKAFAGWGHNETVGAACDRGESSYVKTGARMTLYNSSGQIIATTTFHTGTFTHETVTDTNGKEFNLTTCALPFGFSGLPDSSFYELRVEGYQFSYTFSQQELAGMDWIVRLNNYT